MLEKKPQGQSQPRSDPAPHLNDVNVSDNDKPEFIVEEISKNWVDNKPVSTPRLISQLFQDMIERNLKKGYVLYQFQIHSIICTPFMMNETIIAVFRKQ